MKETETKQTAEKAVAKVEPVKETGKTDAAKAETTKAAKTAAKKTAAVKATAKKITTKAKSATGKKKAVTEKVSIQFNNKAYTMDELVKSAKDRWKYDLKKKVGELKSVELFVKPEDNRVYCVYNGEIEDSFQI